MACGRAKATLRPAWGRGAKPQNDSALDTSLPGPLPQGEGEKKAFQSSSSLHIPPWVQRAPVAILLAGRAVAEIRQFGGAAPGTLGIVGDLGVLAEREPGIQHLARGQPRRAAPLHAVAHIGAGEGVGLHQGREAADLLHQLVVGGAGQVQDAHAPPAFRREKVTHRRKLRRPPGRESTPPACGRRCGAAGTRARPSPGRRRHTPRCRRWRRSRPSGPGCSCRCPPRRSAPARRPSPGTCRR